MTKLDLLKGLKIISSALLNKKDEYKIKFNHEPDGKWYVDFPNWPFDHHNLMMVAGADKLCEFLSNDNKSVTVNVISSNKEEEHPGYTKLIQDKCSLTGGSTYRVINLEGFKHNIWLCPVTLFVLGEYPKYLYIKNVR